MPPKKRTRSLAKHNEHSNEASADVFSARDDGLSIRRTRPRHDETQPPRGYELQPDGWPVQKPPKGARAPSEEDKAIGHALIHMIQWAIGEANEWKPGPNDKVMNDATRGRLLKAYEVLTGRSYFVAPDAMREERLQRSLGGLLRVREQARIYKRIRTHKGKLDAPRADGGLGGVLPTAPTPEGKPDTPDNLIVRELHRPVDRTGAEIVERLRIMGALHADLDRKVPLFDDDALGRLAKLIDELPENAINLGGPGGKGGGRTPFAWARTLVLALKDRNAARADFKKRRARKGKRAP